MRMTILFIAYIVSLASTILVILHYFSVVWTHTYSTHTPQTKPQRHSIFSGWYCGLLLCILMFAPLLKYKLLIKQSASYLLCTHKISPYSQTKWLNNKSVLISSDVCANQQIKRRVHYKICSVVSEISMV